MDQDLSITIDNHRTLWLTEISRETFEDQALDDLGGDGGVFVVLEDCSEGSFEVLAKAASKWAGESLLTLFARSMQHRPELRVVK
ncbi:hypothetical protein [Methylocystis iwaonis]|uniref:Uncharacterized protein n=1 Tax=Methylocystis iwaonis TaxID=2885079 RepID=A0ABN6VNH2_9HYPH|nr:hypothetical protein [Methylocystis iwaonis]BDV35822.1 hypothetical protein SS37A_33510 [Methylocystis iwaonis]